MRAMLAFAATGALTIAVASLALWLRLDYRQDKLATLAPPFRSVAVGVQGAGQPARVVFFGDSRIAEWELGAFEPFGPVLNAGFGGDTLAGMATRERLMRIPGYAFLIQHSHLYAALRERAGRFVKNLLVMRMPWQRAPAPATKASAEIPKEGRAIDAGALDRALVRRIQRVSEENGADFVLFDVPLTFSRTEFATSLQLLDAEFVARLPVLSPLARFQAEARPDRLLYLERGAGHWSARGNVIAAEHVVDYVLEVRLEPRPPESSGGYPTRAEAPTSTP